MLRWIFQKPLIFSRRKNAYAWLVAKEANQYLYVDQVSRPGDWLKIIRHVGNAGSSRRFPGRVLHENLPLLGEILSRTLVTTYLKVGKRSVPGPLKMVVSPYDFMSYLRHTDHIEGSQAAERKRLGSDRDAFDEAHKAMLSWKSVTKAAREAAALELELKTEHLLRTRTPNRREMNRISEERRGFKDSLSRVNPLISGCQFLLALRLADEQIKIDENSSMRNKRRKSFQIEFAAETYRNIERVMNLTSSPITSASSLELERAFERLSFKPFFFAVNFARSALADDSIEEGESRKLIRQAFLAELVFAEIADYCALVRHGGSVTDLDSGLLKRVTELTEFHPAYRSIGTAIVSYFPALSESMNTASRRITLIERWIRYRHDGAYATYFIPREFHHLIESQGTLAI